MPSTTTLNQGFGSASHRWGLPCLLALTVLVLGDLGTSRVVSADLPPAEAPAPVLVGGVPFVSIKEGCAIEHPALIKVYHPSSRAAHMMVLRYHRPDAKTWEDYLEATDEQNGPLREEWGDGKTLDELRALLSAGNPVLVVTANTPYAHELYGIFEMLIGGGAQFGVNLQDLDSQDYSSRIVGRMVGLDVHRKIGESFPMNPLHEIATRCVRVVVGFDLARRVVIVHDPVFGPAWEVPYDDFEAMWSAADRMYCVLMPKDGARPSLAMTAAYPPRTPDQQAAEYYLYGYSLAATGRPAEAEERYRAGLNIRDLSAGYRFIFLQERGYLAYRQKRSQKALALLRRTTEQIPQAPGPWFLMAQICRETGAGGGKSAADEFQRTAEKLAGDEEALGAGLEAFPDNLLSFAPLITVIPGPAPK